MCVWLTDLMPSTIRCDSWAMTKYKNTHIADAVMDGAWSLVVNEREIYVLSVLPSHNFFHETEYIASKQNHPTMECANASISQSLTMRIVYTQCVLHTVFDASSDADQIC